MCCCCLYTLSACTYKYAEARRRGVICELACAGPTPSSERRVLDSGFFRLILRSSQEKEELVNV